MRNFLALLFIIVCSTAFSAPRLTQWCFNQETRFEKRSISWKYCLFVTEGSKNTDVLYHFHGLMRDNIETGGWSALSGHYGLPVREQWEKLGFEAPLVVSISFGELWLLGETNSSAVSGLYEFLLRAAIPEIEKNINSNIGLIGKRHLVGESMGGFNVSQLILKSPRLFSKAAMLSPAIANLSPFATAEEIQAYIETTGANPDLVESSILMAKYFFPTPEDWAKHSPLELAPLNLGNETPQMYVSCGDKDEFGFFQGAELFSRIGVEKTLDFTWVHISGGNHHAVDPISLAGFFVL